MHRRRVVAAISATATLCVGGMALAQQPGPAGDDVVRLPPVVVTAPARLPGAPLPLSSVPAGVQILEGDAVRSPGAPTLQESLRQLPGVTLGDQQGNTFQPDLGFRGFQVSPVTGVPQGISVFVDGVRMNEPTVEEVNFDLLPVDDIDRIELIRGPSAIFGRNTLGGALNITTRRGTTVREIVPEIEGGSFGRQKYRLRLGGTEGPFDLYGAGAFFQEDGWRDETESRVLRFFGKLGYRAEGTDATVSFQRAENRIEQAGSLPASELRAARHRNFTGGDFFKPESNVATVNVRQELGAELALSVNAFGRTLDAEQFNVNLVGDNTRSFTTTTSAGGTVQVDHETSVFARLNRLTVGVEYVYNESGVKTFEEEDDGADRELHTHVRDRQHAVGVYVQDTLELAKDLFRRGDGLVVTGAVRWDWLRHAIEDRSPESERPRAGGTSTFSRANPRFGMNYNLSRDVGVYFVFAQGFRAPAFLELTCASPGAICPGLQAGVAPDPPLKAVKANHYEVGARARPVPWLDVDASIYRTDVIDDIFSISPTGTTGLFFQNVGDTRRQGVELGLRARVGTVLEPYVNYTYTEATFRDDVELATSRLTEGCTAPPCAELVRRGNELPLIPRHRVNAGLDYHVTDWLTLWLGGAYVGTQRFRGDEANVAAPLSSYVIVNGGLRARWKRLTGFVTVNNVLDAEYETFGTFAPNARREGAPVEPFVTPAPPINVLAGLSFRF